MFSEKDAELTGLLKEETSELPPWFGPCKHGMYFPLP
jgi:hypothetical protein